MALGIALAALVGLALGLLGGGGSILAVPVFVYVLGFGAREAIAASLAVVGSANLVGSLGQWRAGNVNLRLALPFGLVAMVGAYAGSRYLAPLFSGAAQLSVFAVVMLLASGSMLRGGPRGGSGHAARVRSSAPRAYGRGGAGRRSPHRAGGRGRRVAEPARPHYIAL